MQNWDTAEEEQTVVTADGLSFAQFEAWHEECRNQPAWRAAADKESDYLDGNQLDSELIRAQQAIGMAPAIDPLMGPELDELCGLEARLRKNWKVVPNSDATEDELAEAMTAKLFEAEKHSKADNACSIAFRGQAGIGVGWLCVDRANDPFRYPYRVTSVNRNDIWWDWKGTRDPDMHDHRYLIRRRWTDKDQAKLFFPKAAELIEHAATGWAKFDRFVVDGGESTGLLNTVGKIQFTGSGSPTRLEGVVPGTYALLSSAHHHESGRGSSIEEQEWRDTETNRICIYEVWYRTWGNAKVFRSHDGRTIEVDNKDPAHQAALASGLVQVEYAVVSKVRVSMWIGPHKISDEPGPFAHNRFPYVPFWNKREDRTGVPYGLARGWMYHQDSINSLSAKLRWGISAVRTRRTKGAFAGTDDQFRRVSAMVNADIVLDAKAMKDGGILEIERDFQLNDQQLQMLIEARRAIKRTGMGIDDEDQKNDTVPQLETIPNQHGILFDNFKSSRNEVGEQLMSLIIEDMQGKPTEVIIKGDVTEDDRVVHINQVQVHEQTKAQYLTNDISRALLKVVLEDVPSTPTYRGQQLQSFAEVIKSAPDEYQPILFPQMLSLMDIPNRDKVIASIREAGTIPTAESIQQQIDQAVEQALMKANMEAKMRELDLKERLIAAQVKNLEASAVQTGVAASYSAIQTGQGIAMMPQIAPIADEIMKAAGYQEPNPAGVDPNYPIPDGVQVPPFQPSGNTTPYMPAIPESPGIGAQRGIETQRPTDNIGQP